MRIEIDDIIKLITTVFISLTLICIVSMVVSCEKYKYDRLEPEQIMHLIPKEKT